MEVTVAVTGNAFDCVECAVGAGGHELAAAVIGVAAEGGRVVAHALAVLDDVVVGAERELLVEGVMVVIVVGPVGG